VTINLAAAGSLHFLVSTAFWGRMVAIVFAEPGGRQILDWSGLSLALPAVLLFMLFLVALVMACRRRRMAVTLDAFAMTAAFCLLSYDTGHNRYQMQIMTTKEGCIHLYFTWWRCTGR